MGYMDCQEEQIAMAGKSNYSASEFSDRNNNSNSVWEYSDEAN
jgi:hypothetical protein